MVGLGIRPILVVSFQINVTLHVEGEEERLPYLGNSDFHAWQQVPEHEALLLEEEGRKGSTISSFTIEI